MPAGESASTATRSSIPSPAAGGIAMPCSMPVDMLRSRAASASSIVGTIVAGYLPARTGTRAIVASACHLSAACSGTSTRSGTMSSESFMPAHARLRKSPSQRRVRIKPRSRTGATAKSETARTRFLAPVERNKSRSRPVRGHHSRGRRRVCRVGPFGASKRRLPMSDPQPSPSLRRPQSHPSPLRAPRRRSAVAAALLAVLAVHAPLAAQNNPPGGQQPTQPGGQNPQAQEPGGTPQLVIQGDKIVFSMSETSGMEIKEFIKWAQELTKKRFFYNENELQQATGGTRVSFLGTFTFNKDTFANEFFGFFQTMLYIKGFALLARGSSDQELLEIVFMTGPRQREVTSS